MMAPSFISTVMPRLMPMMKRDAQKIRAAGHKGVRQSPLSLSRSIRPITTPPTKNRAESSGNHQPRDRQRQAHFVKGNNAVDHQ